MRSHFRVGTEEASLKVPRLTGRKHRGDSQLCHPSVPLPSGLLDLLPHLHDGEEPPYRVR